MRRFDMYASPVRKMPMLEDIGTQNIIANSALAFAHLSSLGFCI
jgi:hypothetical protein